MFLLKQDKFSIEMRQVLNPGRADTEPSPHPSIVNLIGIVASCRVVPESLLVLFLPVVAA